MAGAFVAVADDATAAYWNPAGLPTGAFFSMLIDHSDSERWVDRAQADSSAADQAGTIVALSTNAVAFSYYRLRINQIERAPPSEAQDGPARKDQKGGMTLRSRYCQELWISDRRDQAASFRSSSLLRSF